jgi:DNA-3-methyladenine glycosylase II
MATATKTPAKRAASHSSAAGAAGAAKRAREARAAQAVDGSVKAAGKRAEDAVQPVAKRALNGNGARASKPAGSTRTRAQAGNGALPAAPDRAGEAASAVDGAYRAYDPAVAPVDGAPAHAEATRPAYWDRACADLVKRDRILKKLIPKFGPVHLTPRDDPFVTLARSVVGQQVSVPSAQAAWARVEGVCPKLVPQQFIRVGHDGLTGCGLSKRKAEYILDLAEHFVSGALHVGKWTSMEDEAVIAELTQIRGIGRWTAEMFLIFNLSRPDVLPLDDLGLIRAISLNYFSGEPVTRSEAREVAANWEPWRTVATWYMWRSLDPLAAGG